MMDDDKKDSAELRNSGADVFLVPGCAPLGQQFRRQVSNLAATRWETSRNFFFVENNVHRSKPKIADEICATIGNVRK